MTATAMERTVEITANLSELMPLDLHHQVSQFLFLEARLQDTHAYDEWEALWTDDALYWVPANGHDTDPEKRRCRSFTITARASACAFAS